MNVAGIVVASAGLGFLAGMVVATIVCGVSVYENDALRDEIVRLRFRERLGSCTGRSRLPHGGPKAPRLRSAGRSRGERGREKSC